MSRAGFNLNPAFFVCGPGIGAGLPVTGNRLSVTADWKRKILATGYLMLDDGLIFLQSSGHHA